MTRTLSKETVLTQSYFFGAYAHYIWLAILQRLLTNWWMYCLSQVICFSISCVNIDVLPLLRLMEIIEAIDTYKYLRGRKATPLYKGGGGGLHFVPSANGSSQLPPVSSIPADPKTSGSCKFCRYLYFVISLLILTTKGHNNGN